MEKKKKKKKKEHWDGKGLVIETGRGIFGEHNLTQAYEWKQ